jgi:hypothetical protein
MKWPKMLEDLRRTIKTKWQKNTAMEVNDRSNAFDYFFKVQIESTDNLPLKQIKGLILQNPWTAINTPPTLRITDNSELEIGFAVINENKGKMIEEGVRGLLSKNVGVKAH